jgi:hypothetical protein
MDDNTNDSSLQLQVSEENVATSDTLQISGSDVDAMTAIAADASLMLSTSTPTKARSELYYFRCVVFEVEGMLFNVPRQNFIKDSEIFRTMYQLPQGTEDVEGSSDTRPLVLKGVTAVDFEAFLSILYPLGNKPQTKSLDEWISVLRLSTM